MIYNFFPTLDVFGGKRSSPSLPKGIPAITVLGYSDYCCCHALCAYCWVLRSLKSCETDVSRLVRGACNPARMHLCISGQYCHKQPSFLGWQKMCTAICRRTAQSYNWNRLNLQDLGLLRLNWAVLSVLINPTLTYLTVVLPSAETVEHCSPPGTKDISKTSASPSHVPRKHKHTGPYCKLWTPSLTQSLSSPHKHPKDIEKSFLSLPNKLFSQVPC